MKKLIMLVGLSALGFGVASAGVLWSQPNTSADGYFSDGVSTNGTQWYSQSIADNFSLTQDSTITMVRFWGSSENFVFPDLSNFSAWDVYFYDPAFSVVASDQVAKGSFVITATGGTNGGGGTEYMFELATNFNLSAGSYNMHVGSINVAPADDAWAWSTNNTGDNVLSANFHGGLGWESISDAGDLAFELEGQPVPEPATMVALGLGAIALMRRRRKTA